MNEQQPPTFPDAETCWQALVRRDTRYDGVFFTGVHSTHIYCRPGCPSRLPRRDGVTFFASGAAARAEGYRACRRCQPDEPATRPQAQWVEQARRLLDSAEKPPALAELAESLGVSPFHLQRVFKAETGLTPRQYAAERRLDKLKHGLQQGRDVTTAMYAAGFGSSSRLYEGARQSLGMTPGAYRNGGKGMEIRYTTLDTPLGRMLLAATDQGLCKVSFGADDQELEAQLAGEFPRAERRREPAGLQAWVGAVQEHLVGKRPALNLPLDAQGTAFQQRVWAALRQIPYGETRTYAQLAETIGQPGAVRAAAHACASNPLAVVTPCHRIVRSDGTLGGYRWGLERKQKLLQQEKNRK